MALVRRFALPAVLLSLVSLAVAGEGRRKINALEIPRLAADGSLPQQARAVDYFFLDESAGDLVVVFPPGLTEENLASPPGLERVTERVRLAIGVRPTVQTAVSAGEAFRYEYRLENESGATKRLSKWVLQLSSLDGIRTPRVPRGWDFETWELPEEWVDRSLSVMNLIPEARPIAARDLVRKQARWWYRGLGGEVLEPGTCCASFTLESANLPGIVTAYFQGSPYKVAVSSAVPEALRYLIPAFNFIETNSVSMPVIGPRFEPETLVEARVCTLAGEVRELALGGRLDSSSFTEGLAALSKDCLSKTPAQLTAAVQALPAVAPEVPFEGEILGALQINLAFR